MKPIFSAGNVRANCPNCSGAVTTYEYSTPGGEHGTITIPDPVRPIVYKLLRCAGCGRGGLAAIVYDRRNHTDWKQGELVAFLPRNVDLLPLPDALPDELKNEFREAELCGSVQAWRAASALLRSALEKTLKANGFNTGSLENKIDQAAADGVITEARSKRAHEDIRVLGNDVLHDAWRAVTEEEFELAHHYTQRILEDFYDDRPTVEALLTSKGRLKPAAPPELKGAKL
jgi:hypothetical protein